MSFIRRLWILLRAGKWILHFILLSMEHLNLLIGQVLLCGKRQIHLWEIQLHWKKCRLPVTEPEEKESASSEEEDTKKKGLFGKKKKDKTAVAVAG